jgi:LAO/AO transport system kinase
MIEDDAPQVEQIMRAVYPHTGNSYLIGFTGPPGAGKSTLVDELVRVMRTSDQSVGIIAVDPNSPFTGGAILGDRIRMMRHATDPQVFIRSMGARGHLGGLAVAAQNASFLFDAMGMSLVLVETVGVGQSELEIAEMADTTVVVMPPGFGDGVQAIKAGIMEIADIFVVNKADHPMAAKAVSDIRDVLRMDLEHREWTQPIVRTIATSAEGLEDLWMRIQQHRGYLEQSGELRRRRRARIEREIMRIAERKLLDRVLQPRTESQEFETMLDLALEHRMDPYAVADHIASFRDGR